MKYAVVMFSAVNFIECSTYFLESILIGNEIFFGSKVLLHEHNLALYLVQYSLVRFKIILSQKTEGEPKWVVDCDYWVCSVVYPSFRTGYSDFAPLDLFSKLTGQN